MNKKTDMHHDVIQAALHLHQTKEGLSVRELVQACLDMAETLTRSSIGFLHFVNDDELSLELVSWSTRTQAHCYVPNEPDRHYPVSSAGVWVDCIREGKAVIHNDYASLPHKKGLPEGHVPLIREILVPIFDEQKIVGVIGVGNKPDDYTDEDIYALTLLSQNMWMAIQRKRAEEALLEQGRLYRQIFTNHSAVMLLVDPESGRILDANPAAAAFYGYSLDKLLAMNITEINLLSPQEIEAQLKEAATGGKSDFQFQHRLASGELRDVEIYSVPIELESRKMLYSIIHDITHRKRAEAALLESRRRLSMATQSAGIGFHEVDLATGLITWDAISYDIHGYALHETITLNRYLKEILHPDDVRLLYPLYQKALASDKDSWKGTFRILHPDGNIRWIDEYHLILRDRHGKATRTLGAKTDVTKRKRNDEELARYRLKLEDLVNEKTRQLEETREQLLQSQKLEAIGQLAGGIAHDLNNLLTVILGFGESVLEDIRPEDPMFGDLEQIQNAGNRAASLTRQLLAFSRRQTLQPKTLNLNRILQDMEKMLTRLIGEDIALACLFGEDLWPVHVDPGQMEQVIMNLVINARDAMPDGGKLTLETSNIITDETYSERHLMMSPGPYVVLMVSDTGKGMSPKDRGKIFEPFFTTKERGKGAGLGLSTVYGIVKQSGGHIWVYSEPGMGSTFKIYLPRKKGADVVPELKPLKTESGKGESILVVEDESSLHLLMERMLVKQGYACMVTSDAEQAIGKVARGEFTPDLLITDVVMPQMSGKILADRINQIQPEIRVLYMSGYTDNTIVRHGVLEEGLFFIQKPFNSQDLARKIREVLA
jgi:two-component system, cell cycle sensor histidine kinase and response regulator CckA